MSDESLSQIYPSVANPVQLKNAVAALKQHDAKAASGSAVAPRTTFSARASATPNAVVGTCSPNSIIDNSPGAACTPAYPDPNNSAWQNLVNPLITFGAFSPTDYPSVSSQQCGLTVESNLVEVVSALNGTVTAAAIGCGALTVLGQPICDAAVAVVGTAGAISQGLLADCSEQDGNVNSAEIDAGFHNTVTIFNDLNGINNQISNEFSSASTQLSTVNNQITGEFGALSNQVANVDIHLTNVDSHITAEFSTLTGVVNQATAELNAYLKQIMKLELTPNGQKVINPAILTCTGTNCPNVLAHCPAAGCSWNDAGPLP
ncbi:MAG: hypothetical protein M3Y57_12885 [Acidobacteriota bacterium]|nr:hypothetical protein [Acidobacteriota bacterium]